MLGRSYITLGTVIRWLLIVGALGGFVAYVLWQSRIFLTGPVITIESPPAATTSDPTLTLVGHARNIVWIRVNDRDIVTTPDGDFKEVITLEAGYTIVELSAADRFGRVTERYFPVVYQPLEIPHSSTTNL